VGEDWHLVSHIPDLMICWTRGSSL
jgi:hypothetical protein